MNGHLPLRGEAPPPGFTPPDGNAPHPARDTWSGVAVAPYVVAPTLLPAPKRPRGPPSSDSTIRALERELNGGRELSPPWCWAEQRKGAE